MTVGIVVADDHEVVRAGFAAMLDTQPDFTVLGTAADGAEAVRTCRELRPDVVLMDVRMPGTDGIDATRQLTSADPAPRVLILTTFDLDEYVYDALRAGASGFLLKDVTAERLFDAVRVIAAGEALLAPSVTRRLIAEFAGRRPRPGNAAVPGAAAVGAAVPGAAAVVAGVPGAAAAGHPPALGGLTPRETEVMRLIAEGLSNTEIARRLVVTEETVKTHVSRILAKLGLRDRTQAVVLAYESGLVVPGSPGTPLPEAGGLQERAGDDRVPGPVRVLVRAPRRVRALPGQPADHGDVARQRAAARRRHRVTEVRRVERPEHVRDPGAMGRVDAVEQAVVARGQPLDEPGGRPAGEAVAPQRQRGQVVGHAGDPDTRPRRGADARHYRGQVAQRPRDVGPEAGGDLAEALPGAAVLGVVGADVDGDEEHVPAMGAQEGRGGGKLRTAGVAADPAVHHRGGRLARTAELHQPQRRASRAQRRVQLVGIPLPGLDADPRRVRLDALGQRVAERQVVAGLPRRGRPARRARRRARPRARRDRRHGSRGRDAYRTHGHLPEIDYKAIPR